MVVAHKIAPIAIGNQLGTSPPEIRNPTAVTKNTTTRTEVTKPARCDVFVMCVEWPNGEVTDAGPWTPSMKPGRDPGVRCTVWFDFLSQDFRLPVRTQAQPKWNEPHPCWPLNRHHAARARHGCARRYRESRTHVRPLFQTARTSPENAHGRSQPVEESEQV